MITIFKIIGIRLAEEIAWPVVFYVLVALFVLWILRRLDLSPLHLLREMVHEIVGLLRQPGLTRRNIDGALTVAFLIFTLVVLIVTMLHEVPDFLSIFKIGVETEGQPIYLLVFMLLLTAIVGILSLHVTR